MTSSLKNPDPDAPTDTTETTPSALSAAPAPPANAEPGVPAHHFDVQRENSSL
jgi:hypothetical protein